MSIPKYGSITISKEAFEEIQNYIKKVRERESKELEEKKVKEKKEVELNQNSRCCK